MRFLAFFASILALYVVGCAARVHTVTAAELRAAIESHSDEGVNEVSYAGTQQGYHYIVHGLSTGSVMYEVPAAELDVENPFPVTSDRTRWRQLQWDLEPMPDSDR